ncbi:MAG: metal-dependent transcriptional regulator [Thermoleophilia bacterium]|nr:metal-dependent transcriptional regulator [Thermoleophilia bacterium]
MAEHPAEPRPSPAVQDYLKAVYGLVEQDPDGPVTTSRVAEALGVTPASASNMLKRLGRMGYVSPVERGVELTGRGRRAALEVVRHHRLLETYLATALGVPWDQVHDEAEVLEHHISEALEARIAAALGHPDRDPHGDPIPTAAGHVAPVSPDLMCDLPDGARAAVARVSDRDPALLRFLAERGIVPDALVEVVGREPFGGPIALRVGGRTVRVPPDAARAVNVRPAAPAAP